MCSIGQFVALPLSTSLGLSCGMKAESLLGIGVGRICVPALVPPFITKVPSIGMAAPRSGERGLFVGFGCASLRKKRTLGSFVFGPAAKLFRKRSGGFFCCGKFGDTQHAKTAEKGSASWGWEGGTGAQTEQCLVVY